MGKRLDDFRTRGEKKIKKNRLLEEKREGSVSPLGEERFERGVSLRLSPWTERD